MAVSFEVLQTTKRGVLVLEHRMDNAPRYELIAFERAPTSVPLQTEQTFSDGCSTELDAKNSLPPPCSFRSLTHTNTSIHIRFSLSLTR